MAKKKDENIEIENNEEVETSEVEEVTNLQALVASVKKEAFKTRVVTITSNDKRDNDVTNAVMLTCENQFFNLSKVVPLNVPVELEQCLIDSAKDVRIPIHSDEVINGRRTGNAKVELVNKYNISFED
ncbi:hypothetical protein [Campylobacter concisus]|uniref:Uncharacterized protein n=1 Tax=Campylobacter concisus TaxID=199 RepID=A0A1Y5MKX0_9BACT|nr:hypothetical protein [Campylobacter concisus]OUT06899.1 hypothetical protein B9N65_09975 [Campylobacter concisus]OUT08937.1 hypothetical protein B9N65_00950 [Campylobacter concisus]